MFDLRYLDSARPVKLVFKNSYHKEQSLLGRREREDEEKSNEDFEK